MTQLQASELEASDGTPLWVSREGVGAAVLFSAGFCQTADNFAGHAPVLAGAGYTAARWDYRGHGRSGTPDQASAYSMGHVQDDLGRVIEWASPDAPVVLAGLSFGGLASLHYALAHPDRVRGLVLIATGPGFKKAEAQAAWEAQVGRVAKRLDETGFAGWTEGAAAAMSIGRRPELPVARTAGETILAQNPMSVAHFGRRIAGPAPGVVDDLARIEQPTLILVGAEDKAFLRAGEVMAARMPNAQHRVIPDAGHCLNIEQADRFHEELLDFLATLP